MSTNPSWQDDVPAELVTPGVVDLGPAGPGEVLTGFLDGPIPRTPGPTPVSWRLYRSTRLDRYFEIDQVDILGAVRLPSGETLLRLKPDALVRSVTTFRAGDRGAAYLDAVASDRYPYAGGGPADPPGHTKPYPCGQNPSL